MIGYEGADGVDLCRSSRYLSLEFSSEVGNAFELAAEVGDEGVDLSEGALQGRERGGEIGGHAWEFGLHVG